MRYCHKSIKYYWIGVKVIFEDILQSLGTCPAYFGEGEGRRLQHCFKGTFAATAVTSQFRAHIQRVEETSALKT
jgi:hypothetical protein